MVTNCIILLIFGGLIFTFFVWVLRNAKNECKQNIHQSEPQDNFNECVEDESCGIELSDDPPFPEDYKVETYRKINSFGTYDFGPDLRFLDGCTGL